MSPNNSLKRTTPAQSIHLGEIDRANRELEALHNVRKKLKAYYAEHKEAERSYMHRAEILEMQLRAILLIAAGKSREGMDLLRQTAVKEESLPMAFGPPFIDKQAESCWGKNCFAFNVQRKQQQHLKMLYNAHQDELSRYVVLKRLNLVPAQVTYRGTAVRRSTVSDFGLVFVSAFPNNPHLRFPHQTYFFTRRIIVSTTGLVFSARIAPGLIFENLLASRQWHASFRFHRMRLRGTASHLAIQEK